MHETISIDGGRLVKGRLTSYGMALRFINLKYDGASPSHSDGDKE